MNHAIEVKKLNKFYWPTFGFKKKGKKLNSRVVRHLLNAQTLKMAVCN